MSIASAQHEPAAMPDTARQVNHRLRLLCELTYGCLQAIDSDELDALTGLLDQRQAVMAEIDRLQATPGSPASGQDMIWNSREPGTEPSGHLETERRDLLHLMDSLDSELVRLSAQKRDDLRAAFQKILTQSAGPAAEHAMAGRLFSRIG